MNIDAIEMWKADIFFFFFSSRRRHTRFDCDWSSDVCSSDLAWIICGDAKRVRKTRRPKPITVMLTKGSPTFSSGNARDRKSTRLNSSHSQISYAVFCLKKKTERAGRTRHECEPHEHMQH